MSSEPDLSQEFDLIFAGGGAAACVAAGRLTKSNPSLKILIIEGGANNFNNPLVRTPAAFISHLAPNAPAALVYKSEASTHVNNRECVFQAGGILGGGSSTNAMMYTRGQAVDHDNWATEGWYAKDLIPLAKRAETFQQDEEGISKDTHGYAGPIEISGNYNDTASAAQFIQTVKELGFKEIVDLQDFEQFGGFSRWQKYVGRDGKRSDTAHGYIHPLLQSENYPNLHILVNTRVIRVLFDEDSPPRATGVEFHSSDRSASVATTRRAFAKKFVIIAAGALGTPQILERSGVGSSKILSDLNIPVISDLPGVGENYQDHPLVGAAYKTSLAPGQTLDCITNGTLSFATEFATQNPILAWNGVDIGAKLHISQEEAEAISPTFAALLLASEDALNGKRHHMLTAIFSGRMGNPSDCPPGQYVVAANYIAYPSCRGSIHITSAASGGYRFQANLMDNDLDVGKQVWAYKKLREVVRRLPYFSGELGVGQPAFPPGSAAALVSDPFANRDEIRDVVYSKEDDAAIEDFIRDRVGTAWHSLGTCAMAPREKGGVVDGNLNVHGTKGLKVADLSMVPQNVGANTYNTAIIVGEKTAVIVARELGLDLETQK